MSQYISLLHLYPFISIYILYSKNLVWKIWESLKHPNPPGNLQRTSWDHPGPQPWVRKRPESSTISPQTSAVCRVWDSELGIESGGEKHWIPIGYWVPNLIPGWANLRDSPLQSRLLWVCRWNTRNELQATEPKKATRICHRSGTSARSNPKSKTFKLRWRKRTGGFNPSQNISL